MIAGHLVGSFLQMMIRSIGAKHVVEVGTFTGYSSMKMAQALPEDGTLVTLEYNEVHAEMAQRYFDRSPGATKSR